MNKLLNNLSTIFAATLFCAAIFISCEEKNEKTTTTTTTEDVSSAEVVDSMDTGKTRPVLTEIRP